MANHYKTLTLADLKAMPVAHLAADDAAMFMWCVSPMIDEAIDLMKAWGFRYKTVAFTWVKLNRHGEPFCGLGRWTRSAVELCLLGVRGKPVRLAADVRQVVTTIEDFEGDTLLAQRMRHSRKPPEVRDRIVRLLGDVPRLELFARERVEGWHGWGNEYPQVSP